MKYIVHQDRLSKPRETLCESFPALDFQNAHSFHTLGEPVLVTDPTYLVDVYNSLGEEASFLRRMGVFLKDFGGDTSGPVWWQLPFALMPISKHLSGKALVPPEGVTILADEVGTDSGSFVFLPLTGDILPNLRATIDWTLSNHNGALLDLLAGNWSVWYEQWDAPEDRWRSLYRNIVLKWDRDS